MAARYLASSSKCQLRPRIWSLAAVLGLVMLLASLKQALGCVFHCSSEPCGADVVLRPLVVPYQVVSSGGQNAAFATVRAVDLSGRGITSLAPDAFVCLDSIQPLPLRGVVAYNNTATQAIILDNNSLSEVPPLDRFRGVGFVSLNHNRIASVGNESLRGFSANTVSLFPNDLACSFTSAARYWVSFFYPSLLRSATWGAFFGVCRRKDSRIR